MSEIKAGNEKRQNRKPVILVIDDDADLVDAISFSLSDHGYQVVVSSNMEDALTNFDHANYNLIITDIFMKGIGGIKGIEKIRSLQKDVKIIAISGGFSDMSPENALNAARKIGADYILPKPFKIDQLEKYVAGLLDQATPV